MKDDDHKEHSVIEKGTSYFNIFKCSRNLLDQLNVTYQRTFMASPVQEGLYQPSPVRERYYDQIANSLIEANVQSNSTITDEELHNEITTFKSENEAEHEHSIQDMTQVDDYKSPWKYKDATTVNDSVYKFLY